MIKKGFHAATLMIILPFIIQYAVADEIEKFANHLYESAQYYHLGVEKSDADLLLKAANRRQQAGIFYVQDIEHINYWWSADHILTLASLLHPDIRHKAAVIKANIDRGSFNGGYVLKKINVPAMGKITLTEKFKSRRIAVIYGEGKPGSELDMQVIGQKDGALSLCEDVKPGGYMLCKFMPESSMQVDITVINQSSEDAEFILLTN